MKPLPRRWNNGRGRECRPTREPGWFRPAASKPSMACVDARGSTRRSTELARHLELSTSDPEEWSDETVEDDRLRLIFTCCHPALSPEAQVAMTLREVCGLTTDEIARAFLTKPPTIAQRIVRAKAKDPRRPHSV